MSGMDLAVFMPTTNWKSLGHQGRVVLKMYKVIQWIVLFSTLLKMLRKATYIHFIILKNYCDAQSWPCPRVNNFVKKYNLIHLSNNWLPGRTAYFQISYNNHELRGVSRVLSDCAESTHCAESNMQAIINPVESDTSF